MQKWLLLALLTVASAASATNVAISPAAPSLAAASESNADAAADQEGDFSLSIGAGMQAFKANFKGPSLFSIGLRTENFNPENFWNNGQVYTWSRFHVPMETLSLDSKFKKEQEPKLTRFVKDFTNNPDKSDKSLNLNLSASYKLNLGNGIFYQPEIQVGYNFFNKAQSSSIDTDGINQSQSNNPYVSPYTLNSDSFRTIIINQIALTNPALPQPQQLFGQWVNPQYQSPGPVLTVLPNQNTLTGDQKQVHRDRNGNFVHFFKTWIKNPYNIAFNFLKFGINYNNFTFSPYFGMKFGFFRFTVTDNSRENLEFSKEEKEQNSDLKHEISGSCFLPGITLGFDVAAPLIKNDMFNLKLGLSAAYTWYKTVDIFSDNFFSPKLTKKFNEKASETMSETMRFLSSQSLTTTGQNAIQAGKIKTLVSGSEMAPTTWYVGGSLSFEF